MVTVLRDDLVEQAESQHVEHPQYHGYWDGDEWYVVRFVQQVETKMGVAFVPGDLALCRGPQYRDQWDDDFRAYSFRNKINTAIPVRSFVLHEGSA